MNGNKKQLQETYRTIFETLVPTTLISILLCSRFMIPKDFYAGLLSICLIVLVDFGAIFIRNKIGIRKHLLLFFLFLNPISAGLIIGLFICGISYSFYGIEGFAFGVVFIYAYIYLPLLLLATFILTKLIFKTETFNKIVTLRVIVFSLMAILIFFWSVKTFQNFKFLKDKTTLKTTSDIDKIARLAESKYVDTHIRCGAIGKLRKEKFIPLLATLAISEDKSIRTRAVGSLTEIGSIEAEKTLLKLISKGNTEAVTYLRLGLGRGKFLNLDPAPTICVALRKYKDNYPFSKACAQTLTEFRAKKAVPVLIELLPQVGFCAQEDFIEAIVKLTNESFGYDSYRQGSGKNKLHPYIKKIQQWWQKNKNIF